MISNIRQVQPREFILESPAPPLSQAEVRSFVLGHNFPPPWGAPIASELTSSLTALGFQGVRCRCLEEHPVAVLRMRLGAKQMLPVVAIRRLLRRAANDFGCTIPRGGLNCAVRGNRVEAEIVLDYPGGTPPRSPEATNVFHV